MSNFFLFCTKPFYNLSKNKCYQNQHKTSLLGLINQSIKFSLITFIRKEESEKKIELEKTDKSKEVIPNKVEMISSRFSVIEDHPNDPSKVEEKKTDSSFQKIARQTRITFFNDNLKAEKPKYEANLPHLPAEVNLNVTSNLNNNVDNNKFVDSGKTQQLNKIKFTGKIIYLFLNDLIKIT